MHSIILYALTLPVLAVLDFLWIGVIAKPWYAASMGTLLSESPVWWAAIAFYLLYSAGLVFFVINPALESSSLLRAVLVGAFFGFIAYMTYDLTNIATTTGWPIGIALLDLAWGTVAAAATSGVVYLLATKLFTF